MADADHLDTLRQGRDIWNQWRKTQPGLVPDLAAIDLSAVSLSAVDFFGVTLAAADLHAADLAWADLSQSDLRGANLSRANLAWASVNQADLTGADLHQVAAKGADFSGADLQDARLAGAGLADADLVRANLTRADLAGADLTAANLDGANLAEANLTDANLRAADLTGTLNLTQDQLNLAVTNALTRLPPGLQSVLRPASPEARVSRPHVSLGTRVEVHIYPEGHGQIGNQPVANLEEAVTLLRGIWARAIRPAGSDTGSKKG